ncbi:MAG: SpoIID/LytB domain-containing protein [Phycisphaerales bacterium]|nr:SpoIID/LytB domain-containing protein [Phycisphaerales bacterium]
MIRAAMQTTRRSSLILIALAALLPLSGCSSFDSGPKSRPISFREEPDIRVRVKKDALLTKIDGPSRMVVRPSTVIRAEAVKGPLTFRGTVNGMVMTDGTGRQREFAPGTDVEILPREMSSAERLSSDAYKPGDAMVVDGETQPGYLVIHPRSSDGGVIDVIAVMPIETYVPGVISRELFASWPRQAFECQAVAARSYALHERERSRREHEFFDVESTTKDQVFGGLSSLPVANEAAHATRGMIITEGTSGALAKAPLRTYYSSTCGGEQASAKDVFPTTGRFLFNTAKPLQVQKRDHFCQASTRYRWEVRRNDTELTQRLRAWGHHMGHPVKGMGRLVACDDLDRNVTGRPIRYTLTDDQRRTYRITAEELRNACNFAAPGQPELTRDTRVNSGNLEMTFTAGDVRISGKGFGHGVGMCQYCAKGMAEKGWDWPSMMKLFYPGAGVTKAY